MKKVTSIRTVLLFSVFVLFLFLLGCEKTRITKEKKKEAESFVKKKTDDIVKELRKEVKNKETFLVAIKDKRSPLRKRLSKKMVKTLEDSDSLEKLLVYSATRKGKVEKLKEKISILTAQRMDSNLKSVSKSVSEFFVLLEDMTHSDIADEIKNIEDNPEVESLLAAALEEDGAGGGRFKNWNSGVDKEVEKGLKKNKSGEANSLFAYVKNSFMRMGSYAKNTAKYHISVWPLISALADKDRSVREKAAEELGKIKNKRTVKPLIAALADKDAGVQIKVIEALGSIREQSAAIALVGVLRNNNIEVIEKASQALIHINSRTAVKPLLRTLKYKSPTVRKAAAIILGELRDLRAVKHLIAAMQDKNLDVRYSAAKALVKIGKTAAVPIIGNMKSNDPSLRKRLASRLGKIKSVKSVDALIKALSDKNSTVRYSAAEALGELKDKRIIPPLIAALRDSSVDVRYKAAKALGRVGALRAVKDLIRVLKDRDSGVRYNAAKALGIIKDPRAVAGLIKLLKDRNLGVRYCAVKALKAIGKPTVKPLIKFLGSENSDMRYSAAVVLGEVKDPRAIEPLLALLKDDDPRVSYCASEALRKIRESATTRSLITATIDKEKSEKYRAKAKRTAYKTARRLVKIRNSYQIASLSEESIEDELGSLKVNSENLKVLDDLKEKKKIVKKVLKKSSEQLKDLVNTLKSEPKLKIIENIKKVSDIIEEKKTTDTHEQKTAPAAKSKVKDENVFYTLRSLIAALKSKNSMVRNTAIRGLIRKPGAIRPLVKLLKKDGDLDVLHGAEDALEGIGSPAVGTLLGTLRDNDFASRQRAAEILGRIKDQRAVRSLIKAMRDKVKDVRQSAANALGEIGGISAVRGLINALRNGDADLRKIAAEALGKIKDPSAVQPLFSALMDKNGDVREAAKEALENQPANL